MCVCMCVPGGGELFNVKTVYLPGLNRVDSLSTQLSQSRP